MMLICNITLFAESFRTTVKGILDINATNPEDRTIVLSYTDSAYITLSGGGKFLKGVELEFKMSQTYLNYKGSLAIAFYSEMKGTPKTGVVDLQAEQAGFTVIPAKLQVVYQIPIRTNHGLRNSPYIIIPTDIIPPASFPLLVRIMPTIKGLPDEFERMEITLQARPILADEGALILRIQMPEQLQNKPFTVILDDQVLPEYTKEQILKNGQHTLAVVSDDFRNESRTFIIERGKTLDLLIELQDTTPIVNIESPENAIVFFDGIKVTERSFPAEPGEHLLKFQVGDYSIEKPVTILKGKTYKIALTIDILIQQSE
jgi:hypothetical protein